MIHAHTAAMRSALAKPVQLGYVVDDVFAAARRWAEQFGAGPFFILEHIPCTEVLHRGQPGTFDHSSAYGQWGDVMVELFVQHDDEPSAVREMYAQGEQGLHHMAYFVDDQPAVIAELTAMGYPQAQIGWANNRTRFAFHDARHVLGHYIEIYPPAPGTKAFYEMVRTAAENWDGAEPIASVR
jgi:hypothetical protein